MENNNINKKKEFKVPSKFKPILIDLIKEILINKPEDIITAIFQLDKEIEIISNILGKYALDNDFFIKQNEKKVMGIIRALILYKIIKKGKSEERIKSYFEKFLKLSSLIKLSLNSAQSLQTVNISSGYFSS